MAPNQPVESGNPWHFFGVNELRNSVAGKTGLYVSSDYTHCTIQTCLLYENVMTLEAIVYGLKPKGVYNIKLTITGTCIHNVYKGDDLFSMNFLVPTDSSYWSCS